MNRKMNRKMEYQKLIRDGKVAILVSPGFGAGWSTWADDSEQEAAMFDSRIAEFLLADGFNRDKLEAFVESLGYQFYLGGLRDLKVQWLPAGTPFYIDEYDGSESIKTSDHLTFVA